MPKVPKEVVPEKKVPLVVPKKPEVPPAKGTCRCPPSDGGGYSLQVLKSVLFYINVMNVDYRFFIMLKY